MKWNAGTSGYAYKEWKGPFYPEKLPQKAWLSYYAERLPSVEINNTFYRMPKTSVVATWAEQVPESFRFSLKASRRITHQKRLKEAADETDYLLSTLRTLGDKLGVVLFQLPPFLRADRDRLASFLELIPNDIKAAFEFRHESWLDESIFELLRDRNCALVVTDSEEESAGSITATADWGYLRLRKPNYERADLSGWALRIAETGWDESFAFFKHEDDGAGPRMAASFLELADRQATRKPAPRPKARKTGVGKRKKPRTKNGA